MTSDPDWWSKSLDYIIRIVCASDDVRVFQWGFRILLDPLLQSFDIVGGVQVGSSRQYSASVQLHMEFMRPLD